MALPTATILATTIVDGLSIPSSNRTAAIASWATVCQAILDAIRAGAVSTTVTGTAVVGGSSGPVTGTGTGSIT